VVSTLIRVAIGASGALFSLIDGTSQRESIAIFMLAQLIVVLADASFRMCLSWVQLKQQAGSEHNLPLSNYIGPQRASKVLTTMCNIPLWLTMLPALQTLLSSNSTSRPFTSILLAKSSIVNMFERSCKYEGWIPYLR
jgi:hypothetical protein